MDSRSWSARFAQMLVFCGIALFALQVAPFREHWGVLIGIVAFVFVQWSLHEKLWSAP